MEKLEDGVTLVRNVLIPMPDGVQLAANLYRPAGEGPWPALFTYFPYHKDGIGGMGHVDGEHRYFARHGYACLTVDVRGTGNSGGAVDSPNHDLEPDDGYHVTEWIASQPWCSGAVGLWGVSYGGASTLEVAATNPPHLGAVIPIHGSADEYDGFFRPHGCRPGFWTEADWGPMMVAMNLMPPLHRDADGRWTRVWHEHLSGTPPWPLSWHGGAVDWSRRRPAIEKIRAPMFAICGWQDYYPGVTFRYFNRVSGPKRALIGPWKHTMPDLSPLAPMGGLREMLRWWDRWLRGVENGVDQEPPIAIYVQGADRWRYEQTWPPRASASTAWFLGPERTLAEEPPAAEVVESHQVDPSAGTLSMLWDPLTPHIPYAVDHGPDDAESLAFTSRPLPDDLEICGDPVATIWLAGLPAGPLAAKLCAVAPDGRSTLICRGWNAIAESGSNTDDPAAPREHVVQLDATSFVVPRGSRIRLTVEGADFPLLWPAPTLGTFTLYSSPERLSTLHLPIRGPGDEAPAPVWSPPEDVAPTGGTRSTVWDVTRDIVARTVTVRSRAASTLPLEGGAVLTIDREHESTVNPALPRESRMTSRAVAHVADDHLSVTVEAQTNQTTFLLAISARVTLGGQVIYDRSWSVPLTAEGLALTP
jgi:putative CocE/NonD family hydrolase